MLYCNECRGKQAAAKQTFVFHKPLTNEPSAEQTVERVSAGFMSQKKPTKQAQEEKPMSNDKYVSPLSERYASKEMQYNFFTGYEIQDLEKTLDRAGRDRERTGIKYYTGADRRAESPCR